MSADPPPQSTLTIFQARLRHGVRASPLCIAVMGWLCGMHTEPQVAETRLCDGDVWLRLTDEPALTPLCPFLEFLEQVRVICVSLQMDERQTQQIVAWARHRLT